LRLLPFSISFYSEEEERWKRNLDSTKENSYIAFIGILFPFVVLALLLNPELERR
jgi:hypothetical protein